MSYFEILDNIDSHFHVEKDKWITPSVFDLNMKPINLNETTTADAVSFLPAHLGVVKARVADLAKKKKDWKIEILEQDDSKEVQFEDDLCILVPNEHWESFCAIFDGSVSNNTYLNLGSLLNETLDDEMHDLRQELRVSLAHMYDGDEFRKLNSISGIWKWRFGATSYETKKKLSLAVTQENRTKDIQKLYDRLLEVYGEDRGNLEMLVEAIREKSPLNTFRVFKGYEYLYGTRIRSKYHGVDLYFEALVDTTYHHSETIYCNDSNLLDKIEEESDEVKRVRSVLYPKGGVFTNRFFRVLADTIEDLE